MDLTKLPEFDDHEFVIYATDKQTGLRAFIAIHNTNLGPATGGTRFWAYASSEDALRDVLKLSRAMTYKCAIAGVPLGGGKGVIMANAEYTSRQQLFKKYARVVDTLNGFFSTGEDVGIHERDLRAMQSVSPHINGKQGKAGDLSPWAALGVFYAMQGALKIQYGTIDMRGKSIAVKGVGKLGLELLKLLHQSGARLIAADIDRLKTKRAQKLFPKIRIVRSSEIHSQMVDVFAPCALGGDINAKSIPEIRARIICGGANNQLKTFKDGARLHQRKILYVPDYLANAGGLINVAGELRRDGYNRSWVQEKVRGIRATTEKIIRQSQSSKRPTSEIADEFAEKLFKRRRRR